MFQRKRRNSGNFNEEKNSNENVPFTMSDATLTYAKDNRLATYNGQAAVYDGQIHHIATDKAIVSGFTARFEEIFNKAGLSLQNKANKMLLEGHLGRHSAKYLEYVFGRLTRATEDLSGEVYREALLKELEALRIELINNPEIVKGVGLP